MSSQGPIPILIGVMGHRDLRPEDRAQLEAAVRDLQSFRSDCPHTLRAFLLLAEGADQLAAACWNSAFGCTCRCRCRRNSTTSSSIRKRRLISKRSLKLSTSSSSAMQCRSRRPVPHHRRVHRSAQPDADHAVGWKTGQGWGTADIVRWRPESCHWKPCRICISRTRFAAAGLPDRDATSQRSPPRTVHAC